MTDYYENSGASNSGLDLIFFSGLALIVLMTQISPGKFPTDDGFFYPQIAYNIVQGHGTTFHNITDTNGYHPLWMVFNILAGYLCLGNKGLMINYLFIMQFLLFLGSIWIYKNLNAAQKAPSWMIGGGFLAIIYLSIGTLYLLESFLSLFIILLILSVNKYLSNNKPNNMGIILLGLLLGLYMLSRLDNIFIAVCISIMIILRYKLSIWQIFIFGLATVLFLLPYLAWNVVNFKHIVPISGLIKSSFPKPDYGLFNMKLVGITCTAATASYLLYALFIKNKKDVNYYLLIAISVGMLIKATYVYLFHDGIETWYWVEAYLLFAFLLTDISSNIIRYLNAKNLGVRKLSMFILVLSLAPAIIVTYLRLNYNLSIYHIVLKDVRLLHKVQQDPVKLFIERMNGLLPPHSAVITFDWPGRLAYYSDFKIFPLDGLVNNKDYNDFIEKHGIGEFIKKNQIKYLLTPIGNFQKPFLHGNLKIEQEGENYRMTFYSPINRIASGQILLAKGRIIATFKSPFRTWQKHYDHVAIWEIN